MPRIPHSVTRVVRCANCGRQQADGGRRSTCVYCGCQPVPSYSYPEDCAFYPRPRPESQQKRIERMVAQRRAELDK